MVVLCASCDITAASSLFIVAVGSQQSSLEQQVSPLRKKPPLHTKAGIEIHESFSRRYHLFQAAAASHFLLSGNPWAPALLYHRNHGLDKPMIAIILSLAQPQATKIYPKWRKKGGACQLLWCQFWRLPGLWAQTRCDSERRKAKPLVIHKWFANELPESLGFTVKSTPCKPRLVLKS